MLKQHPLVEQASTSRVHGVVPLRSGEGVRNAHSPDRCGEERRKWLRACLLGHRAHSHSPHRGGEANGESYEEEAIWCEAKAVFCWKHYKNSAFRKTQLFKIQLVKPTFQPCQKTPFSKKRCHFCFFAISAETPIFIVFLLHCFGPKKTFLPKQIVCTKMRVFSPFLTQIVSGNFC